MSAGAGRNVHYFNFFFFRATCEHLLKCKTCICFDPVLCRNTHKNIHRSIICNRKRKKKQETIQQLTNGGGPLNDGTHTLKNAQ